MSDSTVTRSKLFKEDIALATGGTGGAETGQRLTSTGGVLTLTKVDASHLKFRGLSASIEALVDGSNTVDLTPKDVAAAGNVSVAGTSSFSGLGTFATIPVGPNSDPTTANQLTRKSYVDAQAAAAIAACVQLTGDQTVAGIKTFSSFPITPSAAPTTDYQVANKKYVDDYLTVVQVVNYSTGAVASGTTVIPLDDTIPQYTEGDEYMTLAITPTSATNELFITVSANLSTGPAAGILAVMALFKDADADALAVATMAGLTTGMHFQTVNLNHRMVAGTTSPITFKVRCGPQSATLTFNGSNTTRLFGGKYISSITIAEIAP